LAVADCSPRRPFCGRIRRRPEGEVETGAERAEKSSPRFLTTDFTADPGPGQGDRGMESVRRRAIRGKKVWRWRRALRRVGP